MALKSEHLLMNEVAYQLAQVLWDYHRLAHRLECADAILACGSHDLSVADWAAKLFMEKFAPLLIVSGGFGTITQKLWNESEAKKFAEIAQRAGVPAECILVEDRSSNTGENVLLTKSLLEARGIFPQKLIVVHKPYMERRTFATFKKLWPEKDILLTSEPVNFKDYLKRHEGGSELTADFVISIMVGDLQRIKEYPARGFQITQEIPDLVWQAYERLVQLGFTKHLITN